MLFLAQYCTFVDLAIKGHCKWDTEKAYSDRDILFCSDIDHRTWVGRVKVTPPRVVYRCMYNGCSRRQLLAKLLVNFA